MGPRHVSRLVPFLAGALAIGASLIPGAQASRDLGIFCTPDVNSRDVKHIDCAPGVEGMNCGTDWKCALVNLFGGNPPQVVGYDCDCSDFAKTIWSYLTVVTVGDRTTQALGPLNQNASTNFTIQYAPRDSMFIVNGADIASNGSVISYQSLLGSSDVGGTFTLTLGSGPSTAIPIRITALHLTLISFLVGGAPTGPSSLDVTASGTTVFGTYNSVAGVISFPAPVACNWTSTHYPSGVTMYLRPMLKSVGGGHWEMAPRGFSDIPMILPMLDTRSQALMAGIVLVTGVLFMARRRRVRAEA